MIPIHPLREGESESCATLEEIDTFVSALCTGSFVRVPPWFSAGGAREVARYKNARHILIERSSEIVGWVDQAALAQAPAQDVVTHWAERHPLHVAPETSWREALRLLRATNGDALLVSSETRVIGIVTRAQLEAFASR